MPQFQCFRRAIQVLLLIAGLLFAVAAHAVQVQAGQPSISYSTPNEYDYAVTMMNAQGVRDAWFGMGTNFNGNPYTGDVIAHTHGWAPATVELCPTYGGANDFQSSLPLCTADYDPGYQPQLTGSCPANLAGNACYPPLNYYSEVVNWDWGLVNDPSVVKVNGQYYMYWDAPQTGGCGNGVNGQIFLARSSDGVHWVKYPNSSQFPVPVVPYYATGSCGPYNSQGTTDRYGIGEPSVVYKDGVFYLYYTDAPWLSETYLRRATSSDGITFSSGTKISSGTLIDGTGDSGGGIEVRYIPGWDLWFMVIASGRNSIKWNISRDGIHWLPNSYHANERTLSVLNNYANSPGIEGNEYGWVGDGLLQTPKSLILGYTTGSSSDPLTWDIATVPITLYMDSAYGYLDSINSNKHAVGWSYDPDAGVNDAAANDEPSRPLGLDTWVRPVAVSTTTGVRYEGQWQSAPLSRPDLVSANVAPDQYHGFDIDLTTQGFPADTYNVTVEAGEFPVGMGATPLTNTFQVTLP